MTATTSPVLTAELSEVEERNFASIDGVLPYWAAQDIPGIATFYTDEITWHPIAEERIYRGKHEVAEFFKSLFNAIPDMDFVLLTKISRGNFISEEFRLRGTQLGSYFGIPPTGRPVELYGMSMARWRGGKLHADEFLFDSSVLMSQLGVFPAIASPESPVGRGLLGGLSRLMGGRGPEREPSIHLSTPLQPRSVLDIETVTEDTNPLSEIEQENLSIVDRLPERFNARDMSGLLDLCLDDATWQYAPRGLRYEGREAIGGFLNGILAAFPDLEIDLTHRIVRGDMIGAQWAMRGTHEGDFLGVPASGRPIDVPGMTMFTLRDGRIANANLYLDAGMLLRQLGVMPPVTLGKSPAGSTMLWTLVRRQRVGVAIAGLVGAFAAFKLLRRS